MITDRLKDVILRELEIDDSPMDELTTADMVPGWDSLSHARIVAAVEVEYGIRFTTLEAIGLKNVGDLQALINGKLKS